MTTFEYANKVLTGSPLDNFEKMRIMLEHESFNLSKALFNSNIVEDSKKYQQLRHKLNKINEMLWEVDWLIKFYEATKE